MRSRVRQCNFAGCSEISKLYRRSKGQLVDVAQSMKQCLPDNIGVDAQTVLNWMTMIFDVWRQEHYESEYEKEHPFEVLQIPSEDEQQVKIRDLQTGEWRSFMIKCSDTERLDEMYCHLEKDGFDPEPSVDDYMKKLRNGVG